ncbi:hypothetical protein PoB_004099900 [Plakobranchus ocellatus]|uniref:Uncharacterized protein n=1 Tax=Plakobranchus ocellatus TaxID=259542 RepID=A0AAV4B376_9GAST|nr:hypothetical protein PoB_004099900 [Plakobranchus ocellatus]
MMLDYIFSIFLPRIEIGNELFLRSQPGSDLLFQALVREIVFPTDPPEIFIDEFVFKSNATCRFVEDQIWSYKSQTFAGHCYPLVNFQEVPLFKTCL